MVIKVLFSFSPLRFDLNLLWLVFSCVGFFFLKYNMYYQISLGIATTIILLFSSFLNFLFLYYNSRHCPNLPRLCFAFSENIIAVLHVNKTAKDFIISTLTSCFQFVFLGSGNMLFLSERWIKSRCLCRSHHTLRC